MTLTVEQLKLVTGGSLNPIKEDYSKIECDL